MDDFESFMEDPKVNELHVLNNATTALCSCLNLCYALRIDIMPT